MSGAKLLWIFVESWHQIMLEMLIVSHISELDGLCVRSCFHATSGPQEVVLCENLKQSRALEKLPKCNIYAIFCNSRKMLD